MAFDTEAEIAQVVKDKENELATLRSQMQTDFDLFSLLPYVPKDAAGNERKGYQSYTTSEPRNFFNKVLDGLNNAALTIQIRLPEKASEEEKRKASIGELFLFGALQAIDRRLSKRGEPPLRESLAHFMCLRGMSAMRALVYTPKKGEDVVFDALPWDGLHVTWEMGNGGPLWVAHKHKAAKAQILSEYGVEVKGKDAEVLDFFDTERNSVIIEGTFAKKPTEHGIGHVPAWVRFVGSMPTMQKQDFGAMLEYQANSVWAASRGLYEVKNKYISSLMDVQQSGVVGSLVYQSRDGTKRLDGDPYLTRQQIPLAEGEKLYPLEMPKAPPETAAIYEMVNRDIQQSTLLYPLGYGGTEQAMSGRALSILVDSMKSVYGPGGGSLQQGITWLCEELLTQFVAKGVKSTELRIYDKGKPKEKQYFTVTVSPDEINPEWFVDVKVEPRMPRDEQAAVMLALAATQKRGPEDIPFMSKGTARELSGMFQDANAEEDKVLREMGEALPPIMAAKIAKATKDGGDPEGAEAIMALLRPPQPKPSSPPLPPELIKAVAEALVAAGQGQLAGVFVQFVAGQATQGSGGSPQQAQPEGNRPEVMPQATLGTTQAAPVAGT